MAVLALQKVSKSFTCGSNVTQVLKGVNLSLNAGKIYSLVGPSGCGKSTLLHIAGLLEVPSKGGVFIDGEDCSGIADEKATIIRRTKVGFVYQAHHLLPEFTALENVVMPLLIAGMVRVDAYDEARAMLEEFSLGHRVGNLPSELSGGEQQRVAIARAMVHKPLLLLADEPTGNLDEGSADVVFSQFLDAARRRGLCVLMVTHNLELAKRTDKILTMESGMVRSSKV